MLVGITKTASSWSRPSLSALRSHKVEPAEVRARQTAYDRAKPQGFTFCCQRTQQPLDLYSGHATYFELSVLRGVILRLKTRSMLSIGFIAVVAVGATAVSATSVVQWPNEVRQWAGQEQRAIVDPKVSPVVDPTLAPLVDPTVTPVVDPTLAPVVGPTTVSPVVDPPMTPSIVSVARPSVVAATTPPARSIGPARVRLGAAGAFAILTKTGVTDVYASKITGNVGASPITGAAIGLTCSEVSGKIFSVDVAGPAPCTVTDAPGMTAAVRDEEAAYTDAAGRTNPDFVNLGAGQIGGSTLAPGLYKWTGAVSISKNVTLSGGPNDVWIFQIAGTLIQASATKVTLTGGAQAKNVFWQSAGAVAVGTAAHFEGTILSKTMIVLNTGASANGRLLAQTAVTLEKNTVSNVQ